MNTPQWTIEPNGPCFDFYRDDMQERRFILIGMNYNAPGELQNYAKRIAELFNGREGAPEES